MAISDSVNRARAIADAQARAARESASNEARSKDVENRLATGRATPRLVTREEAEKLLETNPYVTKKDLDRNWTKLKERTYSPEHQEDLRRRSQNIMGSEQKQYEAQKFEAVEADFKALQEGNPEAVQDWKTIADTVLRLSNTEGEQAQEMKDALLWSYGDELKPHIEATQEGWWDKNYTEPPEQTDDSFLGWKSKLQSAGPVFDYLDQWGQSALGALGGLEAALDTNDEVGFGEGVRHAIRKGAEALDVTRAIPKFDGISQWLENAGDEPSVIRLNDGTALSMDRDGDGTLNLREALGKDPEAGGRWVGALDLLGTILLDPSTYATLGRSSLAKVGMKAAEEAAERAGREGLEFAGRRVTRDMLQEMNQRVLRDGFKNGLDEAEQRFYEGMLRSASEEAVAAGGRATTRFGRDIVDSQLASIRRGGQTGLKAGGVTIVPGYGITSRLGRGADAFTTRTARETVTGVPMTDEIIERGVRGGNADILGDAQRGMDDLLGPQQKAPWMTDDILEADMRPRDIAGDAQRSANRLLGIDDQPLNRAQRRALTQEGADAAGIRRVTDEILSMYDESRVADHFASAPAKVKKQIDDLIEDIGFENIPRVQSERAFREVVRVGRKTGLLGEILEMPVIRTVLDALTPRRAIAAIHGSEVADQLGHLLSITREDPRIQETMTRLGADMSRNGLMRRSVAEFASEDQWSRAMNEALSSRAGREAALETMGPASQDMVRALHDVRTQLRQAAIDGGANPENLRAVDEYLPRVLTNAARQDEDMLQRLRNLDDPAIAMSGENLTEGFLKQRTIATQIDNLFETNDIADEVLRQAGIAHPAQIFENNPVAAMAARSQSAFRAAMDVELLDGITKLKSGQGGTALGFRASPDAARKLTADEVAEGMIRQAGGNVADYRKIKLDNGDIFRIHEDVAKELDDVRRIVGSPRELTKLGKFFDEANNVWATSATVFGVNPAFHVRNHVGNMFNAFLGGTRNPKVFAEAVNAQRVHHQIRTAMRETGDDFATVAKRLVDAGDVDQKWINILDGARRQGVLNDGRSLDIVRERGGTTATPTTRSRLDPRSGNFAGNRPGILAGEAVENHSRLAVYIDQLEKGATPGAAAQHVKKHLFDYGDLTRFENEGLRRVSRFYTFMRKNTALQAYTLAHYPGRIANAEDILQGTIDFAFGGEEGDSRALPPWMPGASVANVAGRDLALGIDSPFSSFEETVQILTGPPSTNPMDRFKTESFLRGFVERSNALFSGVGIGALDYLGELETGRDSFTGRTLDPENQTRDTAWFGALATVFPAASRFEGYAARAGLTRFDEDGNPKSKTGWEVQLINAMSGLQMYELSDDTDGLARYTLIKDLRDIMDQMSDDGIEVPTMTELRKAGDIQLRNRVAEAIMYGIDPETGEWSDEITDDRLLSIIPKDVRKALNLPEPGIGPGRSVDRGARPDVIEGSEEDFAQQDFDFKQVLSSLENYLERDLSEDEEFTILSVMGGALGVRDQEDAGLNPYRENRFLDPEKSEADEAASLARKEEIFNRRLAAVGMTWDDALERHPRISRMQRNIEDAREAGWTEDEIRQALYFAEDEGGEGWTSRADRAAINQFRTGDRLGGAVPLTTSRYPVTTEEDLQKLQTKVWEAVEELRWIYQFEGWGMPSQEETFMYGVNTLTKTEQRMLGIDPLKGAPNREDERSDEAKFVTATDRLGAVEAGINDGAFRWDPSQSVDWKPWEINE